MNLKISEFSKSLTLDELVYYTDLLKCWDEEFDCALRARTNKDMMSIIRKKQPYEKDPKFIAIILKLKEHNSKINLNNV